jgi:hypothetical protein
LQDALHGGSSRIAHPSDFDHCSGPPAFLDDTAKGPHDEILCILLTVKIELPFKAKFEHSRDQALIISRVRNLFDK